MRYKIDDTILYGTHGVCRITDVSEKTFNGCSKEYYVLKPVNDEKATVFVPAGNEKLIAKMRHVLTADEIHELIRAMPGKDTIWIENESERKDKYKKILMSGDRVELVQLIKTLYNHQKEQIAAGKKLHMTDERFMKDAERLLYEEFAHVLDIQYEQVLLLIVEELDVEAK